jgi:hypothetical protein
MVKHVELCPYWLTLCKINVAFILYIKVKCVTEILQMLRGKLEVYFLKVVIPNMK